MTRRCRLPTMLASRRAFVGIVVASVAGTVLGSEPIEVTTIRQGEYATFLVNWDDTTTPVFRAVIRTPHDYAAVFHPAPVMGNRRPFSPPDTFFDEAMIVVVARVVDAPAAGEKPLTVESLVADGDDLVLRYRFTPPAAKAAFTVKESLVVRVPRREIGHLRFVENGEHVGVLGVADGEWAVPAPPAD